MLIGRRDKVVAAIVLATCAAALVRRASERPQTDPCEAQPGAYACAMFAQPEWLKRRVYAGRMDMRPDQPPAPSVATDVVTTSSISAVEDAAIDGI